MSTHKDDIEKLFSTKFERFEIKPSEGDWLSLSSKLNWMNFWKFTISSLNIYYIAVLAALAGTVVWLGIVNVQLSGKMEVLRDSIRVSRENVRMITVPPADSVAPVPLVTPRSVEVRQQGVQPTQTKAQTSAARKPDDHPTKTEDHTTVPPTAPAGRDSARNAATFTPPVDTTNRNTVRRVKKLVVVKPKTVVVKDTVNVTRPSK